MFHLITFCAPLYSEEERDGHPTPYYRQIENGPTSLQIINLKWQGNDWKERGLNPKQFPVTLTKFGIMFQVLPFGF